MKNLEILFIDDDEIEQLKFKKICQKSPLSITVREAKNGEEALQEVNLKKPSLIILDLNMPKMNGIEFLCILNATKENKYIPTVVLSSSDNEEDIKKCYEVGASGYMIKPLHYEDSIEMIHNVLTYWSFNKLIK